GGAAADRRSRPLAPPERRSADGRFGAGPFRFATDEDPRTDPGARLQHLEAEAAGREALAGGLALEFARRDVTGEHAADQLQRDRLASVDARVLRAERGATPEMLV